jgi:hypothetical protein
LTSAIWYQLFGFDHRIGHFQLLSMTAEPFFIAFSLLAGLSQDFNIFRKLVTDGYGIHAL